MNYRLIVDKTLSFIKKYKDHFLIGVIFILLLLVIFLYRKPVIVPSEDITVFKQVEQMRDANNKLYAIIEQKTIDEKNKDKIVDSLSKALKIKPKFIQGEIKYSTQVDTQFITKSVYIPIRLGDTAYKVDKHDAWVDIEALAGPDTGWIRFSHRDTVTHVEVVKTHLFRSTERSIMINNSSPYSKITHGYSWTIQEKKPWLTVGVGGALIPVKPYIMPAVTVSKPIITFYRR